MNTIDGSNGVSPHNQNDLERPKYVVPQCPDRRVGACFAAIGTELAGYLKNRARQPEPVKPA